MFFLALGEKWTKNWYNKIITDWIETHYVKINVKYSNHWKHQEEKDCSLNMLGELRWSFSNNNDTN